MNGKQARHGVGGSTGAGRRHAALLVLALTAGAVSSADVALAAPAPRSTKGAKAPARAPARAHKTPPKAAAAPVASAPPAAPSPPPAAPSKAAAEAPVRAPTAGAAQADVAVKTEEARAGERTYTFGAQEVEGRLKSPQILYFLRRVRAEFDPAPLGHRSFLLELYDTRRSPALE